MILSIGILIQLRPTYLLADIQARTTHRDTRGSIYTNNRNDFLLFLILWPTPNLVALLYRDCPVFTLAFSRAASTQALYLRPCG